MSDQGIAVSLRELLELRRQVPAAPGGPGRAGAGRAAPGRRSRGMEYAESRPWQPGDDLRAVDWRQSARRGRLYSKLYQEEHERPVQVLVDLGPSMRFGTRVAFKSVLAARAAAWLAWSAVAAGDRIGGLVWNGEEERELPPRGREQGVLPLLRALAEVTASPAALRARDFSGPLRSLARGLRPGSRVVVISDFARLDAAAERQILALAQGAEVRLVQVYDPLEAEPPPPGCYRMSDGRERVTLDLRPDAVRAAYAAAFASRRAALEDLARRAGAPLLCLATGDDPAAALQRAFNAGAA